MTLTQQIITIGMVVLGTMLTRFLPFLLFRPENQPENTYSILARCCLRLSLDF